MGAIGPREPAQPDLQQATVLDRIHDLDDACVSLRSAISDILDVLSMNPNIAAAGVDSSGTDNVVEYINVCIRRDACNVREDTELLREILETLRGLQRP